MRNFSKKLLAVLLCFAMLASVTVATITVNADDSATARNALLSAWQNLVYEKYTPLATAKAEGTAPGIELVSSLPAESALTAQENALFGSTIVKFTGTGAVWTKVDEDVAMDIYDGYVSFDTTKVGIYTTLNQIELHALLGNNYVLPNGWNLVNKGFTVMELKDLNGLIDGLIKGTIDAGGNSLSIICDHVDGNGEIYVGAVMGVNYVKETVPSSVSAMSNKELYDYAVANVTLNKYVDGVEEFEAALNELFKANFIEENPDKAALILAWGNLLKEEAVTLAWGKETSSVPAELNLTDAQKALLGDRLTVINRNGGEWDQRTADTALNVNVTENIASYNFKRVEFSLYTDIAEVELHPYSGGNFLNGWNLTGNGFKTIDVTADMAGFIQGSKAFTGYSYISDYSCANGNVYIGALLGYRDVKETVPADAYTLSFEELYKKASKLDTTKYVDGVEEFKVALNDAYKKINQQEANLIEAWGNLVGEEYVTIAYPSDIAGGSPTLVETSTIAGLTDEQKAKMGSHAWAMNALHDKVQGITWVDSSAIGSCDSYFFVIYSPSGGYMGQVFTQFNGGGDIYTGAAGFVQVNVNPSTSWWSILQQCTENYGTFYVGSVVGHRTVNATVNPEAYTWSAEKLFEEALKVDTSVYTEGVEEFNTALNALYAKVYPKQAALIEAWGNLTKEVGTEIAYLNSSSDTNDAVFDSWNLTAEQRTKFGGKYVAVTCSQYDNFIKNSFSGYDKITISFYAPALCGTGFYVCDNSYNCPQLFADSFLGFYTVDATSVLSGKSIVYFKFENYGWNDLYVGAFMGWKTERATVDPDAYTWTAKQLVEEASKVDTTSYSGDVAGFTAALNALKDEVDTTVKIDIENGELTVNNSKAVEGDVVELTVAPEEGYVLKAGSLRAYDADGKVIGIPTRKGFRESTASNVYEYDTAMDGYDTADGITFKGEYVKESELTAPNMGKIGSSVNTGDDVQGMRNVYRMPITLESDGKYYTSFGGDKAEVTSFGILLCTEKTYNRLGNVMEVGMNDQYLKEYDFINDEAASKCRYDVCDSFEEVSVKVIGITEAGMEDTLIYTCGYIVADGQTYYTDATASCYNNYVR